MKPFPLFPSIFRTIGWLMAVPGLVLGYFVLYQNFKIPGFGLGDNRVRVISNGYDDFTNELALLLVVAGLLFIGFSKTRHENEETQQIRGKAMFNGVVYTYALYLGLICYGLIKCVKAGALSAKLIFDPIINSDFIWHNLYLPLVFFVVCFYYLLYKGKSTASAKLAKMLPANPYHTIGQWMSIGLLAASGILYFVSNGDNLGFTYLLAPIFLTMWLRAEEKDEDLPVQHVRYLAIQQAAYINYGLILVANFAIFSLVFYMFTMANLILLPVIFIIVFRYRLFAVKKRVNN